MYRSAIAVLFTLILAVPARAGLERAASDAASGFGNLGRLGFARFVKSARAEEVALGGKPARPAFGIMSGAVGGRPVSLNLDRRAWTIRGEANGGTADVLIDHDAKTIRGKAGDAVIDAAFDWTGERVKLSGTRGADKINLTVDFVKTGIYGFIGKQFIQATYYRERGVLRGHAKNAPVELAYDKLSGRMSGTLRGERVELVLVNLELGDFLQYFFLLID